MSLVDGYFGDAWVVRLLMQRGMAAIYLVAFLSIVRQFKPLLGEKGLLPVPAYLQGMRFRQAPSIFHWRYSDRLLDGVAWTGLLVSGCALFGLTEAGPLWLSVGAWLLLYVLYLSVANVGQIFFGFGWESMLLEAGFFTAFLGPAYMRPSVIPLFLLRWMLFRTELGAGLIKLRGDTCWRDLTCLFYHYETQPLPNPLSWYFHRQPAWMHRLGVVFSHFVQLIVPFGLFAPQPFASLAAGLLLLQQVWLIVSGNYSWLNWLTAILSLAGLSDAALHLRHSSAVSAIPLPFHLVLYAVGAAAIALSYEPVLNLFSSRQKMNFSYNRYHLVNSYGAFGSVTKERYEIVFEGTDDSVPTAATVWKEYSFRAKPGDLRRTPPQVAPYHLRLDWMIWFLPFTVQVTKQGVHVRGYDLWLVRFVRRLLRNDAAILRMMGPNPFAANPPATIRALFYRYRYTTWQERREHGAWWKRELLGSYLPAVSLHTLPDV
jgi:hypothetical protein